MGFFRTFAPMKELIRIDNPYNEPLLEYVIKVANNFIPDVEPIEMVLMDSVAPDTFVYRYTEGFIDTGRLDKYLASEEVIDTVKAFGLDVDKFWYLCLFIKDVAEGFTVEAVKMNPTHREELNNLVAELDKLEPEIKYDRFINVKGTGELTLKVGKHPIKITDGSTLTLINYAVTKLLDELAENNELLDSASIDFNQKKDLKPVYQIYLFNKYLSWFMKPLVADKASLASKDKNLLISRMIFILGISDDESYFEEYNDKGDKLNFLKNNLRRYQDVEIPTHNSYYWQ